MQMTSKEFRHGHLLSIIKKYGSIERLAAATGMNPQHLSQLKNKTRGIGDKTARKIESALGMPEGAMDRPPADADVNDELIYLFSAVDEDTAINAVAESIPHMSDAGVRRLTAALLSRLSTPEDEK